MQTSEDIFEEPSAREVVLRWLPLGLLSTGILGLLRWCSLLAIETEVIGSSRELATWNAANGFPQNMLHVLVFGMTGAALLAKTFDHERAGTKGPPRALVISFCAAIFASCATGWPMAESTFVPKVRGSFSTANLLLVVPLAIVWALALEGLVRFSVSEAGKRVVTGLVPALVLLLFAASPAYLAMFAEERPQMVVRTTVRQLMNEVETFEWTKVRKKIDEVAGPLELTRGEFIKENMREVISPASYQEWDVGAKYSLMMPPDSEASFTVTADDGEVVLRAATGFKQEMYNICPENQAWDVRFEVLINGESRFDEVMKMAKDLPPEKRQWRHVGGDAGLPLSPGDKVTLRTSFTDGRNPEEIGYHHVMGGFSDLVLERRETKPRQHSSPDFPNVVLIVMDTQRADRMSCYGYDQLTTPNLDRLAARGVRYENAYATSSWTWPSTASILTGLYPEQHGVLSNDENTLTLDQESIAEVLQRRGFTTAAFSCNWLIRSDRYFDQGFEFFDEDATKFRMSDEVMPDILGWLRAHHGTRFFLYLHLVDPHEPHRPHPDDLDRLTVGPPDDLPVVENGSGNGHEPYDVFGYYTRLLLEHLETTLEADEHIPKDHQRWLHELYDASVATGDRYVGEFLDVLSELGLDDRTLIVFTSDHGEELLDHELLAHGHTLYDELVHIPLIVAGPGVPTGAVEELPVSNRHIAHTLARFAGERLKGDGVENNLAQPTTVDEEHVLFQTVKKGVWNAKKGRSLYGLRSGDWVFQRCVQADEVRLFDMVVNREQLTDVSESEPEEVQRLRRAMDMLIEVQRKRRNGEPIPSPKAIEDALGKIGYTGTESDDPPPPLEEPQSEDDEDR